MRVERFERGRMRTVGLFLFYAWFRTVFGTMAGYLPAGNAYLAQPNPLPFTRFSNVGRQDGTGTFGILIRCGGPMEHLRLLVKPGGNNGTCP
jgi:hypothetical protein